MAIIKYLIILVISLFAFGCDANDPEPPPEKPPGYQEDIEWPSLADTPWPMNRSDPQNTARSTFKGPVQGVIEYEFKLPGEHFSHKALSNAIVTSDSSIIFVHNSRSDTTFLYSITHYATVNWKIPLNDIVTASIFSDNKKIIHVFTQNFRYYGIDLDGGKLWENELPFTVFGSPTITKDGKVIVLTHNYKLSRFDNGELEVEKDLGLLGSTQGGLCISPVNNDIIAITNNGSLIAIDQDFSVQWLFEIKAEQLSLPLCDNEGKIYMLSYDSMDTSKIGLFVLNKNGKLETRKRVQFLSNIFHNCAMNIKGDILLPISELNSFDYLMKQNWSLKGSEIFNSPIIDNENKIYFHNSNSEQIECVDEEGSIIWTLPVGNYSHHEFILSYNGRLIVLWNDYNTGKNKILIIK